MSMKKGLICVNALMVGVMAFFVGRSVVAGDSYWFSLLVGVLNLSSVVWNVVSDMEEK